jgi:hypothetical protein
VLEKREDGNLKDGETILLTEVKNTHTSVQYSPPPSSIISASDPASKSEPISVKDTAESMKIESSSEVEKPPLEAK